MYGDEYGEEGAELGDSFCIYCGVEHPENPRSADEYGEELDDFGWDVNNGDVQRGLCPDCNDRLVEKEGESVQWYEYSGPADGSYFDDSDGGEDESEDEVEDEGEDEGEDEAKASPPVGGPPMTTTHPSWTCGKHGLPLLGPYKAADAAKMHVALLPAEDFYRCPLQGTGGCTMYGGLRGASDPFGGGQGGGATGKKRKL